LMFETVLSATKKRSFRRLVEAIGVALAMLLALSCPYWLPVHAQLSTDDHLAEPGWWPRQVSRSYDDYAGSSDCAKCHKEKAATQKITPMARTLMRAEDAEILQSGKPFTFRNDKYFYQIGMSGGKAELTVSDGKNQLADQLVWAFGTGDVGQSYLFLRNEKYFESRVTYFSSLQNIHFTPARALYAPHNLAEAMARPLDIEEVKRCFSCHSTAAVVDGKFEPNKLTAGVTCEVCHGPGAAHATAMKTSILQGGAGDDAGRALVFDPGELSPVDSVDFCGSCHSTWWDVKLARTAGIAKVRAQPYRLESSKCWGTGDARITCVACHDPHVPLVHEVSTYDSKCLRCHRTTANETRTKEHPGAACQVSSKDCVTCHMPKVNVPEMHYAFRDHMIRIVRPGEPLPE